MNLMVNNSSDPLQQEEGPKRQRTTPPPLNIVDIALMLRPHFQRLATLGLAKEHDFESELIAQCGVSPVTVEKVALFCGEILATISGQADATPSPCTPENFGAAADKVIAMRLQNQSELLRLGDLAKCCIGPALTKETVWTHLCTFVETPWGQLLKEPVQIFIDRLMKDPTFNTCHHHFDALAHLSAKGYIDPGTLRIKVYNETLGMLAREHDAASLPELSQLLRVAIQCEFAFPFQHSYADNPEKYQWLVELYNSPFETLKEINERENLLRVCAPATVPRYAVRTQDKTFSLTKAILAPLLLKSKVVAQQSNLQSVQLTALSSTDCLNLIKVYHGIHLDLKIPELLNLVVKAHLIQCDPEELFSHVANKSGVHGVRDLFILQNSQEFSSIFDKDLEYQKAWITQRDRRFLLLLQTSTLNTGLFETLLELNAQHSPDSWKHTPVVEMFTLEIRDNEKVLVKTSKFAQI